MEALELAFRRICDTGNSNNKQYPFQIKIVPKTINSNGLQLADLTARPIGLFVLRPEQENRTYSILKEKLWSAIAGCTIAGNGLEVFPDPGHSKV